MMEYKSAHFDPFKITIGVIGLGLMGSSIITCMLLAGHKVVAIAPIPVDLEAGNSKVILDLEMALSEGIIDKAPQFFIDRLTISADFGLLAPCQIIIESVVENKEIKKSIYKTVETVVSNYAIIATNTSAIPISELQADLEYPERFLGLHMMVPAHTAKFLEIICGDKTNPKIAEYIYEAAPQWNKEPSLLRKDIRGFITNRLMYSMYREACSMVENGFATIEDVDRALRNSAGHWLAHSGIFRWMDLTGVQAYHTVMKDLLPTLNNQNTIPKLIDDIVKAGGKGITNNHGFYQYTDGEAKIWEESYLTFSYEMGKLANNYPADLGKSKKVDDL
jgi:3-hydroxybutyryl-CoA dehydrogenase